MIVKALGARLAPVADGEGRAVDPGQARIKVEGRGARRDAGDRICNIVVAVGRMGDRVPAGARRHALERRELRDEAIVARKRDARAVQPRQQVAKQVRLRRSRTSYMMPCLLKSSRGNSPAYLSP